MVSITLYVRVYIFSRNICGLHFRFVDGCSTYVLKMTAPEAKYVHLDRRFGNSLGSFRSSTLLQIELTLKYANLSICNIVDMIWVFG